jgi:hypothetical protein
MRLAIGSSLSEPTPRVMSIRMSKMFAGCRGMISGGPSSLPSQPIASSACLLPLPEPEPDPEELPPDPELVGSVVSLVTLPFLSVVVWWVCPFPLASVVLVAMVVDPSAFTWLEVVVLVPLSWFVTVTLWSELARERQVGRLSSVHLAVGKLPQASVPLLHRTVAE